MKRLARYAINPGPCMEEFVGRERPLEIRVGPDIRQEKAGYPAISSSVGLSGRKKPDFGNIRQGIPDIRQNKNRSGPTLPVMTSASS